ERGFTALKCNMYRFDGPEEVSDLALPELLDDGVTLVEWGDTIASALPSEHLSVTIRFGDGDDDRSFELRGRGETWNRRADRLRTALKGWAVPC
ncbi:MAG: hypothetical protein F4Z54_08930, partial [Acidimicrobiaceae bacterium]|nr:hypothetical protein [Acidimicrobiaceae bacterium]